MVEILFGESTISSELYDKPINTITMKCIKPWGNDDFIIIELGCEDNDNNSSVVLLKFSFNEDL